MTDISRLGGDRHDFELVNRFARDTGWLHVPVVAYATYGVILFAGLLVVGWWLARRSGSARRTAAAVWAGIGTVLAVGLNQPLVSLVHEARPYTVIPHALLLVPASADPSFPSDHATMAGAVAAGLFLVNRRLGVIAGALALLMGFARVYVGAHYPIDVAAGLAVGAAVVLLGYVAIRPLMVPVVDALGRSRLRPLVLAAS